MTDNLFALQRPVRVLLEMLTDRDLLVLKDLEQFRLLSTRQLQRLRFITHSSTSSATRTTIRVLGRLERHGLVTRLIRRVGGSLRGSAGTAWQLASVGERLLRAMAGDPNRRRYVEPSIQFAAHTLAVADCAISLIEADRAGTTELLELQAEPDCWREHTTASGSREWVKPDLYAVNADADFETHTFIEIDLGTEHLPAVLRKCAVYQRHFASGSEQTTTGVFPAVVWITTTSARADKIRAAIRSDPTLTNSLFHATTPSKAGAIITPTSSSTITSEGGTP
jgi:hypothetical protein